MKTYYNNVEANDDVVDSVTLMEFEQGELSTEDEILMCSRLLINNQLLDLPKHYTKLANKYISEGILDDEGNVNFIKLKEYL